MPVSSTNRVTSPLLTGLRYRGKDPEMAAFAQQVNENFQRIDASLLPFFEAGTDIITYINNSSSGSGGFVKKVSKTIRFNRVGDNTDYEIDLDTSDWRTYLIVIASGNQYDAAPAVSTVTGVGSLLEEPDAAPAAEVNLVNIPGNVPTAQLFIDGTDSGKLKIRLNDGGGGPYAAIATHVVICVIGVETWHTTPDHTVP